MPSKIKKWARKSTLPTFIEDLMEFLQVEWNKKINNKQTDRKGSHSTIPILRDILSYNKILRKLKKKS